MQQQLGYNTQQFIVESTRLNLSATLIEISSIWKAWYIIIQYFLKLWAWDSTMKNRLCINPSADFTWGCCKSELLTLPNDHWALTANVQKELWVVLSCWCPSHWNWAAEITFFTDCMKSPKWGTSGLLVKSTCCSRWQHCSWLRNSAQMVFMSLLKTDIPASLHSSSRKG